MNSYRGFLTDLLVLSMAWYQSLRLKDSRLSKLAPDLLRLACLTDFQSRSYRLFWILWTFSHWVAFRVSRCKATSLSNHGLYFEIWRIIYYSHWQRWRKRNWLVFTPPIHFMQPWHQVNVLHAKATVHSCSSQLASDVAIIACVTISPSGWSLNMLLEDVLTLAYARQEHYQPCKAFQENMGWA